MTRFPRLPQAVRYEGGQPWVGARMHRKYLHIRIRTRLD